MKKMNAYSSSRNHGLQRRLVLLIVGCLLVAAVWGVSTIWLRHLTSISYAQIARLETEKQELVRRAATLNNGIAYAQSPENMRRELMRVGSDLRLPTSSQVIRVNSAEFMATTQRYRETESTSHSVSLALWDRQQNP